MIKLFVMFKNVIGKIVSIMSIEKTNIPLNLQIKD
jgi:hypothetical protein